MEQRWARWRALPLFELEGCLSDCSAGDGERCGSRQIWKVKRLQATQNTGPDAADGAVAGACSISFGGI